MTWTYRKSLLNSSELKTKRLITPVLEMMGIGYHVLVQVSLSEILPPDRDHLSQEEWSLCMNGSVDFVVVEGENYRPCLVLEFDGPIHDIPRKKKNDAIKNRLFKRVGLPLVRLRTADISSPPSDLRFFLSERQVPALFVQYVLWYLTTFQAMQYLVDSSEFDEEVLHYFRLRDEVLGQVSETSQIVYAFGEGMNTQKEGYWIPDMDYFHMVFGGVPYFTFRRVHDGILSEATFRSKRFASRSVQVTAFGIDSYVADCVALSYHVRCLLARIAEITKPPEKDAVRRKKARMRSLDTDSKSSDEPKEDHDNAKQVSNGLLLCSDSELRKQLHRYAWRWEQFLAHDAKSKGPV